MALKRPAKPPAPVLLYPPGGAPRAGDVAALPAVARGHEAGIEAAGATLRGPPGPYKAPACPVHASGVDHARGPASHSATAMSASKSTPVSTPSRSSR